MRSASDKGDQYIPGSGPLNVKYRSLHGDLVFTREKDSKDDGSAAAVTPESGSAGDDLHMNGGARLNSVASALF